MTRRIGDWGGNIAAFAVVIVFNILSSALPLNGQSMPEISAKYPSLFTPSGVTFSVWGIIYLGLFAFVIYQALPHHRDDEKIAAISPLFQLNCLANAAWIVAWHYDLLIVSMLIMLGILTSLVLIYRRLDQSSSAIVSVPFRIYTAWICVATIANLSVIQNAYGLDDAWLTAIDWTLLKIALAGSIAAVVVVRKNDIFFAAVVGWAAYGISTMQAETVAVAGAARGFAAAIMILIAITVVTKLRPPTQEKAA